MSCKFPYCFGMDVHCCVAWEIWKHSRIHIFWNNIKCVSALTYQNQPWCVAYIELVMTHGYWSAILRSLTCKPVWTSEYATVCLLMMFQSNQMPWVIICLCEASTWAHAWLFDLISGHVLKGRCAQQIIDHDFITSLWSCAVFYHAQGLMKVVYQILLYMCTSMTGQSSRLEAHTCQCATYNTCNSFGKYWSAGFAYCYCLSKLTRQSKTLVGRGQRPSWLFQSKNT